jgi:hypothetical protein
MKIVIIEWRRLESIVFPLRTTNDEILQFAWERKNNNL